MKDVEGNYPKIPEVERKKLLALQKKKDLAVSKANFIVAEFQHATSTAVLEQDGSLETSALCLTCGVIRPKELPCPVCR